MVIASDPEEKRPTAKQIADFPRKMYRWRHNSFFGSVEMARMNMRAIINADSTSPEAKEIAATIDSYFGSLKAALRTRIDPPKKGNT